MFPSFNIPLLAFYLSLRLHTWAQRCAQRRPMDEFRPTRVLTSTQILCTQEYLSFTPSAAAGRESKPNLRQAAQLLGHSAAAADWNGRHSKPETVERAVQRSHLAMSSRSGWLRGTRASTTTIVLGTRLQFHCHAPSMSPSASFSTQQLGNGQTPLVFHQ